VTAPLLLLADEPTGNLDSANSDLVTTLLRKLVDERGQTILMVTHSARQAALADRMLRLCDGKVVEEQVLSRGLPFSKVLADLESSC
jgi:putative ABC transport system ATP-binding protein